MFRNYIKIAFRSLLKQKGYSLINVAGLSVSLAVTLLMLLWVQDEWSTDKFHLNGDRLYRVKRTIPMEGQSLDVYAGIPYPVLAAAEEQLPEVEKYMPLGSRYTEVVKRKETTFREQGSFGNSAFFEAFSYPILQGAIGQLDEKPDAVAISETLARKLFGNVWESSAIGEVINIQDRGDFSIEAVYADFPTNSSVKNDYMVTLESHLQQNDWMLDWGNSGMQGAVLLAENADPAAVAHKIETIFQEQQEGDRKEGITLQKYEDHYLYGQFDDQARAVGGRIEYVRTFGIAALLLLIISCINFVNLATARASKRAKEVGVRKSVGAQKQALIAQFMVEAGVITFISIVLAYLLAELLLPQARIMTDKMLDFDFTQPVFLLGLLGIFLLTTLLSGAYPAFILSSYRPVNVLKGQLIKKTGSISFRKGLVILQFVLALLLIVGALVVQQQIHYIQHKNLGINKDNLITIDKNDQITEKYDVLRQQLLAQEGIGAVTATGSNPIDVSASTSGVGWPGKRPDQQNLEFHMIWAETNFTEVFEIPMVEGQFYRPGATIDTNSIVFNEAAIRIMGLEDPIGATVQWWGRPRQIIGVTKDFHNRSLYDEIAPTGIILDQANTWSAVFVKSKPGMTPDAIAGIENAFKGVLPNLPLHFEFVDQQYQQMYTSEVLTGKLANYFAIISILLSCMGLLGLATFFAEQKRREIGIRKVLGASVVNLMGLLSKEFLILVAIGLLIGVPVSWYLLNGWLDQFAYQLDLQVWMFVLPVLFTILIAGLTVGFQAFRAAVVNPVRSLRQE